MVFKDKDGFWIEAVTREARIMNGEDIIVQAWDLYFSDDPRPQRYRIDLQVDMPSKENKR